jgi:DNA polymerase III sliding clamp (beta) subunit (PCNA family)
MKWTTKTEDFKAAVTAAKVSIPHNASLPILGCIKMVVGQDRATFFATDLDSWVTVTMPLVSEELIEEHTFKLSAETLEELAREAASDEIVWEMKTADSVKVKAGKCKLTLQGLVDEFPAVGGERPDPFIVMEVKEIADLTGAVAFATSKVSLYPVLTSIYIEIQPGKLRFTATDRQRLATVVRRHEEAKEQATWIVPGHRLEAVTKLWSGDISLLVATEGNWVYFWDPDLSRVYAIRQMEGPFPEYAPLLKQPEGGSTYKIHGPDLEAAIRRVQIVSHKVTGDRLIQLAFNGSELTVSGSSSDRGEGREVMTVEPQFQGTQPDFWVASSKLLDSLRAIPTKDLYLTAGDAVRPILLKSDDNSAIHVLVPRRAP